MRVRFLGTVDPLGISMNLDDIPRVGEVVSLTDGMDYFVSHVVRDLSCGPENMTVLIIVYLSNPE